MSFVLIVEDDKKLAIGLKTAFLKQGLKPILAKNLQIAKNLLEFYQFELAILDRILPDGDGITLIAKITQKNPQAKILMLTTRAATVERVEGLGSGADDYLSKPFSYQELMLRIKNLLTKYKLQQREAISYQGVTLFPQTQSLVIDGKWIKLRPKESEILSCLLYHQELLVTHQILLSFVWGAEGNHPKPRSVSVYIRRLRIALGRKSHLLQSIRGVGYILSAKKREVVPYSTL